MLAPTFASLIRMILNIKMYKVWHDINLFRTFLNYTFSIVWHDIILFRMILNIEICEVWHDINLTQYDSYLIKYICRSYFYTTAQPLFFTACVIFENKLGYSKQRMYLYTQIITTFKPLKLRL